MTNVIQKSGGTYHQCGECKLIYAKKAIAEQCEAWCKEHKTCNIEIIKHAIDQFVVSAAKNSEKSSARKAKNILHVGEERRRAFIRFAKRVSYTAIFAGIAAFGIWYLSTRPNLPPTDVQGHIEESPNAHISATSLPDAIQRHMLEHADGKGKPGVLIQYNCKKYQCDPNLIQQLTALVKKYPDNVYLAPNDYDGEIILTKLGRIKIFTTFNEQVIKDFIEL